jgi:hypothetical protein
MTKIKWESVKILESRVSSRPFKFNDESDIEYSDNFSFYKNGLTGQKLIELAVDGESIKSSQDKNYTDGQILYAAFQEIITCDYFEHEGDDNFMQITEEIKTSIEHGFFILKNITCYDEADMCTVKFEKNNVSFFVESNPFYEDSSEDN